MWRNKKINPSRYPVRLWRRDSFMAIPAIYCLFQPSLSGILIQIKDSTKVYYFTQLDSSIYKDSNDGMEYLNSFGVKLSTRPGGCQIYLCKNIVFNKCFTDHSDLFSCLILKQYYSSPRTKKGSFSHPFVKDRFVLQPRRLSHPMCVSSIRYFQLIEHLNITLIKFSKPRVI